MARTFVHTLCAIVLACTPHEQDDPYVHVGVGWTPAEIVSESRPTALFIWAPWCEECFELLPAFDTIARLHGGDLTVATVCIVDGSSDLALTDSPKTEHSTHYVWEVPLQEALTYIETESIPALVTYDSNGRRIEPIASSELSGPLTAADVADAVDALMP